MCVITIAGSPYVEDLANLPVSAFELEIARDKISSPYVFAYSSMEELLFELQMRSRIIQAAMDLFQSGAQFAPFQKSFSNEAYWRRTPAGNFDLRDDVEPAAAIRDIFQHGSQYAFECATAIMIVFAKAILDSVGDDVFNTYFKGMRIGDWTINNKLPLILKEHNSQAFPGDSVYFDNPDFDPEMPFWQGENAIFLGKDMYYGHGIGIRSSRSIIQVLNSKRKPHALRPAHRSELVLTPNYSQLYRIAQGEGGIVARIGEQEYVCV